jgi:hypothetical protein
MGNNDIVDSVVEAAASLTLETKWPSDKELFEGRDCLSIADKRTILQHGPCQPSTLSNYYIKREQNGIELRRKWLCYSHRGRYAYCETCWLFGDKEKSPWADKIVPSKRDGISKRMKTHETSEIHLEAHKNRLHFVKSPLDAAELKVIEENEKKWSLVIERVFAIIISAASMNIGLRGHREVVGEGVCEESNFLELVKLLAQFDDLLENVIATPKGKIKYLSPAIQNEMISLIAQETRMSLVSAILKSPYFSIILDSTVDLGKVRSIFSFGQIPLM